jgi:hypothetical protein
MKKGWCEYEEEGARREKESAERAERANEGDELEWQEAREDKILTGTVTTSTMHF